MPATGVCPPERMLVTVRAMAPVAGMPPNSTDAMLAAPWAVSSTLELCLSPVMPSATTHESSDSMPASRAMVMASGNSSRTRAKVNVGQTKLGSSRGMPPNRLPMVSTCNPSAHTAREATATPTTGAGMRGMNRRVARMHASANPATHSVVGLMVPRCSA